MSNEIALKTQAFDLNALMMNPDSMDRVMRMAEMMASGKSTIPVHLQKNPADCMAVVMQSMQWGMIPNVVAQKTHLVNGTLGYEAQLVNAVVQSSGAITGRFHYEYKGASPQLECRVGAVIRGESEITWGNWLNEAKVTTKNSPLWKVNPSQQLGYLQVKNWARMYCPGAILGVYTPDELEQPTPINMGAVDLVGNQPAKLAPGVLEAAQNAAESGVATYAAYWGDLSPETRAAIGKDEHRRLTRVAKDADAARTVESAQEPRKAKTFDAVMNGILSAQNTDALYVAGEFIGHISDPDEVAILSGKFDERKAELEVA